ncbi:helix-turn-helix transcriptional regulator [Streptomyces sp. NBC_01808]|uniref:AraC family transcriptional regulator n=1 Tax=Streptomyces sp. NBC_01808 TaxID=2975947 RepID=UPI002DD7FD36|nr:helix-turn-helix transcriptional regulator [Streptomyces sp. NBC_01808]WSA40102.1 helix-turn-helix transcriptional regulator [Streptomyces sp. NBC_01808]
MSLNGPAPPTDSASASAHGGGAVLVAGLAAAGGGWTDRHRHPVPQLAWARSGVLMVRATGRTWVLPATTALWIPPGVRHATGTAGTAEPRTLYVRYPGPAPAAADHPLRTRPPADRPGWSEPTVVAVTPLLRALCDHLADDAPAPAARARAEAVVLDQLTPVAPTSVLAPMPRDPRPRAVAEALRDTPADARTLAEWSPYAGAAPRTLARLFVAETGMPFGRWRTHLRLQASLPLLASGATVATAARHVGYASPSAFVAAFHRTVGAPPGTYFPRD